MRLRNKPWAAGVLAGCSYYYRQFDANAGHWHEVFGNDNPIWLEIGCGKGLYLAGMGPRHPEINFVGADIKGLVLAYGIRYIDEAYKNANMEVKNVKLISFDAERIVNSFKPEDTVDKIILNFSNPWPKPKHWKKRLTYPKQLELYRTFLRDNGEILFKTDNDELYESSIVYFGEAGFEITEKTDDYYSIYPRDEAVMTEHEKKFSDMGMPIHFIRAVKK